MDDFLDGKVQPEAKKPIADDSAIDSFLDGKEVKNEPAVKPRASSNTNIYKAPIEYAAGFNDELLNTLDLPNDAFNWAAEKLGVNFRIPSTRDLGSDLRIGYKEGEEPDTGAYKSGEFTAMGLEFLAPILKVGGSVKSGATIAQAANPSISRGVAQKITEPFLNAPKTAFTGEIAGSALAGYGAYEGRERYGWKGEQAAMLLGGMAPQTALTLAPKLQNRFMRSIFPMTKQGAKPKARQILESLSETKNIESDIVKNRKNILEGANISPARKTDDPDLMALEKVLTNEDPELARQFRKIGEANNETARKELDSMKGVEGVQEAQLFLKGRYAKLMNNLNAYLDIKTQKAQDAVAGMNPKGKREALNSMVRESIDTALVAARKDEDALWQIVPVDEKAKTSGVVNTFVDLLNQRYKSEDPSEIPKYIYSFLGRVDKKGAYKKGTFNDIESAGELHAFRKRLLKDIRREKKVEAPDWNKVRILDDLQKSSLKSLEESGASSEIKDAIAFSRSLNEKFKGGIMSTILGSDAHGGRLSPSLTLESVGVGAKGADNIKKILNASPDSKDPIEQVLKMEIAYNLVNKNTQRLKLEQAKKYLIKNDEIMDMFPSIKKDMERAIAMEEKATWYPKVVKTRMDKAKQSSAYAIANASPKRVISKILEAKDPAVSMTRELKRLNNKGKAGIKNDILSMLEAKSSTGKVTDSGEYVLSGDRMYGFWTKNKNVLGRAFKKDELRRIDKVINTLRLSEGRANLPVDRAKNALEEKHGLIEHVVSVIAARGGAKLGAGTSGASLKTASEASTRAKKLLGNLDVGMAKKLLKDAILDEELYIALTQDTTKFRESGKNWRVIQGWMATSAIESMKDKEDN